MSGWTLSMIGHAAATQQAAAMSLRPDMAEQLRERNGQLPEGPIWGLYEGDRVIGLGGLARQGSAASLGWLLIGDDLTRRDWAMARRAIAVALEWAGTRAVRRVHALVSTAPARALLKGLGFRAAHARPGDVIMTLELEPVARRAAAGEASVCHRK